MLVLIVVCHDEDYLRMSKLCQWQVMPMLAKPGRHSTANHEEWQNIKAHRALAIPIE